MVKHVAVVLALVGMLVSCDHKAANRREELLVMAAEEVAAITDTKERLTRQLNIAELQIARDHKAGAAKTLTAARETLLAPTAGSLDELGRMSGWVSISELARAAGDKSLAGRACDDGRELLSSIKPEAARCEYVLGLADEIKQLRGQEEAGRLVIQGGAWASTITDQAYRRQALVAFMDRLMNYEDYAGARQVIRKDPDALWRADTLTAMARAPEQMMVADQAPRSQTSAEVFMTPGTAAAPAAPASILPATRSFGKDLNYKSNYQRGR